MVFDRAPCVLVLHMCVKQMCWCGPAAFLLSAALGGASEGASLLGHDPQAGGAAVAGHWGCQCCRSHEPAALPEGASLGPTA